MIGPLYQSPRGEEWRERVRPVRRLVVSRALADPAVQAAIRGGPPASMTGWVVLMSYTGKKEADDEEGAVSDPRYASMGSPGSPAFLSITAQSTGAASRTRIGDGDGLYRGFFDARNITRIALVDGSSSSLNPTAHTNYAIYDLVESSGSESVYEILVRLDGVIAANPTIVNNDGLFGESSVRNLTAGLRGYSGLMVASGGTAFRDNDGRVPTKFALKGINRDSDNDIQSIVFYSGNLETGKNDSWRGPNPEETFWSYWGHDFHSNHLTKRIGDSWQTLPGVSDGAMYDGPVYVLAFSGGPVNVPPLPSEEDDAPFDSGGY
jgi:hypothetical protein